MKKLQMLTCLCITVVLCLSTVLGTAGSLYTAGGLEGTAWILSISSNTYITLSFYDDFCKLYAYDGQTNESMEENVPYTLRGDRINISDGLICGEWYILEDTLIILDDEGYGYSFERHYTSNTNSRSASQSGSRIGATSAFANTHWHAVGMDTHYASSAQQEFFGTSLEDLAWLANGAVTFVPHIRDLKALQLSLVSAYFGIDFYSNGTWEVNFECWSLLADLLSETSLDATSLCERGVWVEENGTIMMFASSGLPIPLQYKDGVLCLGLFGLYLDFVLDR